MAWVQRLVGSFRSRGLHREIEDELRYHLERRLEDQLAAGLATPEARRAARQRFGDVDRIQERTRDMDILTWLETWLQDLKQAARMMRRAPGFTMIVVLSLALGIGANAAIFSLVNAVLLQTLPVPNPEQLYGITISDGRDAGTFLSYPLYRSMEIATAGRAELGAFTYTTPLYIPVPDQPPEAVPAQLVSGHYFSALGTRARVGRLLEPSDNQSTRASEVAVVSYKFWQSHFGGSTSAVGRQLQINGVGCEIVGVAPRGFLGFTPDSAPDIWLPLALQARLRYHRNVSDDPGADLSLPWTPQDSVAWLVVLARMPNAAATAAILGRLDQAIQNDADLGHAPRPWRAVAAAGAKGNSGLRQAFAQPLTILLAMVGLMLLIACSNIAAMLLARGVNRRREITVRISLGLTRARLTRQLLTEGFLLGSMAGAAGLVVGRLGSTALARRAVNSPSTQPLAVSLDWHVLLFLVAIALLVGALISALPAWQASHMEVAGVIKSERTQGGRLPFGRGLIIGQVALSLLLVAGAGLFSRSLARLASFNPGFDRAAILNVHLDPRSTGIPPSQLPLLYQRLRNAVDAVPGVESTAFSECALPSPCNNSSDIYFSGVGTRSGSSENYAVSNDYFATTGIQILRGRGFAPSDGPHSPIIAVVNQAFAAKYFPGRDPIGQRFGPQPEQAAEEEIVGMVRDARIHNLRHPPDPQFFLSLTQHPQYESSLQVRTAGDPAALAPAVLRVIARTAPGLPANQAFTTAQLLEFSLADELLLARLSDMFGILALTLACLGLYGVTSYTVARRTSEFGLRLALGAPPSSLLRSVLSEALALAAAGAAIGLPLALAAGRLLQNQLHGLLGDVSAMDPTSLAAALALLLLLPALAALIPALRAARVDPMRALRTE